MAAGDPDLVAGASPSSRGRVARVDRDRQRRATRPRRAAARRPRRRRRCARTARRGAVAASIADRAPEPQAGAAPARRGRASSATLPKRVDGRRRAATIARRRRPRPAALERDEARRRRAARRPSASGSPPREARGDRGEQVAAVEGRRHRLEPPRRARDVDRLDDAAEALGGEHQQAVVGPDEQPVLLGGAQRDRAPPRADLGVDDGEVHAGRRERQRALERERPGEHVVARDAVPEVDDARLRAQPRDHPVDHADELVARGRSRRGR